MIHKTKFLVFLALSVIVIIPSVMGAAFFQEESELVVDGVFEEKFDNDFWDRGWESRVMIGNPNGNFLNLGRKRLSFLLPQTETSVMLVNEVSSFPDVKVEATFENIRSNVATYAIMCRYSEDGWYELRIGVTGSEAGSYKLMKYDAYLKDQYKNPYVLLHKNMDRYFTGDIKLGSNVKNKLGLLCEGDEIKVYINDKEQFPIKNGRITDDQFEEGGVGFSAQSYGSGIADIDITKFNAAVP